MKICLVLEGSYPYVRGGVSTWAHSFIRAQPETEFVLWTITDLENKKGKFKYKLPANVVEVHENFLSTSLDLKLKKNPNIHLSFEEKDSLRALIQCAPPDWEVLMSSFHLRPTRAAEFFLSEEYLSILKDLSRDRYPFAGFKDLFWTIRSMFLPLLHLISQPMPEAALYHSPSTGYAGVLAALAAKKHDKPFVLTEHGIYAREREEEILRSDWVVPYFKDLWISMYFLFSRFSYEEADRVTSLYHHASLMQQEMGCPSEKCEIVPNGIDFPKYASVPIKPENDTVDIAAIVRFAPIKDIKTLIYTFSRLKQIFEPVKLHILGGVEDEDYYRECRDLILYLGLEDILIPGNVDIISYLEEIDFTVLTSISEGQPFAILESLAARRPVVVTDVGACRELVEGQEGDLFGHAGICVPPMHQSELLGALLKLCQHPDKAREMGNIGQKRVETYYTKEKMVDNYLDVYKKVIDQWQE